MKIFNGLLFSFVFKIKLLILKPYYFQELLINFEEKMVAVTEKC